MKALFIVICVYFCINFVVTDRDQLSTQLIAAAEKGDLNATQYLLENGIDVNIRDPIEGRTPLMLASKTGKLDVVKLLLVKSASVNATDNDNATALHFATQNHHVEIAKLLIENGASVKAAGIIGLSPLHHAAIYGYMDLVKLLIEHNADANALNDDHWTPIYVALQHNNLDVAEYLLEKGANLNVSSTNGWNPLHLAARVGDLENTNFTLENGIDFTARDEENRTALDLAVEEDHDDIVDIITRFEANHARPAKRACKRYGVLPIGRIVGGGFANSGEFPWMVAIGYQDLDNTKMSFNCGGTIISEFFVLTAAHCMNRRTPVQVRVGTLSLTDVDGVQATTYEIEKVTVHPQYLPVRNKNDIALIRVAKEISFTDFVIPACLQIDKSDVAHGTTLIVTGWGSTSADRIQISTNLRQTNQNSVPLQECNATLMTYNTRARMIQFESGISDGQYCALDVVNHSDSCQGDSGGPLQYFPTSDSLAHIVGIVSFGISCGTNLPGIYTRVAFYLDWIESVVWPK